MSISVSLQGKVYDKRAQTRMKAIIRDHLESLGFDGEWKAELYKKTGEAIDGEIEFKKIVKNGENGRSYNYAIYGVRPYDRGTSWRVVVIPPEDFKINNLENAENPNPNQESHSQKEEEVTLTRNQLCMARVVGKDLSAMGINITIEDKYDGFIPLQDISYEFNKKELNKFHKDQLIRVVVVNPLVNPIVCSSRTDGIASTTNKNDVFSGIPDNDGYLSLHCYTKDIKRSFEFLEFFAIIANDYKPNPVPRDEAYKWVEDNLKEKYQAKTIASKSVQQIFTALTRAKFSPWIKRIDDPPGYLITDNGWLELKSERVPTVQEDLESIAQASGEIVETHGFIEKASEVIAESQELLETVVPEEIQPKPEMRDLASPDVTLPSIHEPSIDDVLTYIRKSQRLIDITEERRMLETEITELTAWILRHKSLQKIADKFYQGVIRDGKNILDEK